MALAGLVFTGALLLQIDLLRAEDVLKLPNPEPTARFTYGDDALQFADLRLPEGDGPHPVAVIIHGGCWRSEYTIEHIGTFADALANVGIASWAIEYRRVGDPGGGWPGTFQDVGAALDRLRPAAEKHALDLKRVVVVGHSAGGHLALWLGARPKLDDAALRGENPLPLKGIVSLAGVDDLRRALEEGVCDDMAAQLVGGTPDEVPERYEQGSPVELLPIGVPQHLINGGQDSIVPEAFGRAFASAARRAGDRVKLTVIPEAGHFELIVPATAPGAAVMHAIREMLDP